jgi:hypothetical protein
MLLPGTVNATKWRQTETKEKPKPGLKAFASILERNSEVSDELHEYDSKNTEMPIAKRISHGIAACFESKP